VAGPQLSAAGIVQEETMLPKKQHEAFSRFSEAAYESEVLDARTTLMLQMATAMVIGCYP